MGKHSCRVRNLRNDAISCFISEQDALAARGHYLAPDSRGWFDASGHTGLCVVCENCGSVVMQAPKTEALECPDCGECYFRVVQAVEKHGSKSQPRTEQPKPRKRPKPKKEPEVNPGELFASIVAPCAEYDNFYIGNNIPRDKLLTALRDYGGNLNPDDVLCLYDSTIFGGGGDGFMVTLQGLFWKRLWSDGLWLEWSAVNGADVVDPSGSAIKVNGYDVDIPSGGATDFADMFNLLANFFRILSQADAQEPPPTQPPPSYPQLSYSDDLLDLVRNIVGEQLGVDPRQVTLDSRFVDDLGADSLDAIELVMALEEAFAVAIPEKDVEKLLTVRMVVEYLRGKGF